MTSAYCPAIFLAAPASGQGKTTITAGLSRLLKKQGKVVRVFKTGPDYLDPQVLSQASGSPVEQLDMWMAGEDYCQNELYKAALVADLIIIEGAMGLFDGEPSSADLAARFNIPLVIVMDVKGMAQTAAAIAQGLATFRDDIQVAGLIANNCGSDRHQQLIQDALPESLPLVSTLKRSGDVALPERHLGLVQAEEITDVLEHRFDKSSDYLASTGATDWISALEPVAFYPAILPDPVHLLSGKTIAVAKDEAFSFIYASNIQLLTSMGAKVEYFSPLRDSDLPLADALWLPGGYPELHAEKLSKNTAMLTAIKAFYQQRKPMLSECGGFLYCLQRLTDLENNSYPMVGILSGDGAMRGKRGCQGMQTLPLPEGEIRGHAHHRSISSHTPEPIAYGIRQRHPAPGEPIYREGSLTASYLHLFFSSNPEAIAALFLGSHIDARQDTCTHAI